VKQQVDLDQAWPLIIERLRTSENEQGVRLWLAPGKVRPIGIEDGILDLECPTHLYQVTIRDRFAKQLAEVAADILGFPVAEVRCRVPGPVFREHERRKQALDGSPLTESGAAAPAAAPAAPTTRTFGHGYKQLDQFVVGSCNRLAYDAVRKIVDEVNPLFIHGASGMGKTHLAQGLAVAFKERHPKSKVQYLRCEQFTNDFITACDGGPSALQAFRVKMRHPDLLLIDDIHFLSQGTKVRTKDELFSTFNQLAEVGKKVVITSDASPRDIQYLEDRFVQRFAGGLVIELQKPDPQVRRDIVRAKARQQGIALADAVVGYVAEHITASVRELEGAVNKLVQYHHSFNRALDLEGARACLADLVGRGEDESAGEMVVAEVARYFGITIQDVTGKSRSGPRSTARHVAMYVLRSASSDTYAAVGHLFGVKSHSSVTYACEQVAKYRTTDAELDSFIGDLLLRVRR